MGISVKKYCLETLVGVFKVAMIEFVYLAVQFSKAGAWQASSGLLHPLPACLEFFSEQAFLWGYMSLGAGIRYSLIV